MSVHHTKQSCNVFHFLLRWRLLVLVELFYLFVSDLEQDLLWLLSLEELSRPALLNCVYLNTLAHQLGLVNHCGSHTARFLIECILDEFFLEPEVLRLLLLFAFALNVLNCIHFAKFCHFFLLLLFHGNIMKNRFTGKYFVFVTAIFSPQEIISILLSLLQAFVSRHESLFILISMIFDILISSNEKLFCL